MEDILICQCQTKYCLHLVIGGSIERAFHLGQDYELHESNVSRIIKKIEEILIKCGKFSLPSKRRLLEEDEFSYTIVDVTEMMIERPKKTKAFLFGKKEAAHFEIADNNL